MTTFTLLGCPVRIEAEDDLLAAVLATLPPVEIPTVPTPPLRGWRARAVPDGIEIAEGTDVLGRWPIDGAARVLGSAVELFAAEHASDVVVVHAGAVAVDGRAILLPGRTLAGKSTLTAALLAAGATYYSDEFALLRPDGTLLPYPRPISLRPGSPAGPAGGGLLPAASLGARIGSAPAPVAVVARLRYRAGPALEATPVSAGRTSLMLIDNAVAARSQPARVLQAATAVAEHAVGLDGERGDAAAVAGELITILAKVPVPPEL